ncbi:hypothetical protein AMELA_G00097710 [Ameiurus melas]|uniref:Uncharacterized protein n=1 Tax=Ameiurus melas TaxID=219545 RepID=A0A7J6AU32_AMEME|nr:hypothetical protein AMELA_G00097710 [Ameiurus melas]
MSRCRVKVEVDTGGSSCARWRVMEDSSPRRTCSGCVGWAGAGMARNPSSPPCSTYCSSSGSVCSRCHTRLCCRALWVEPLHASHKA